MRRWGKPQPRIFSHKGKAFKFYSSFGGFLRVPAAEEFTSEPYLPNRTIWFEELEAIAYTPKQVVGLICSNLCTRINAPEGIKSNEWNQRRWINYIEINRTHTSIWIVHIFKSNHITWTSSTGYMRISWTAVQITVAFQIGTSWKMVELSSMLFTCAQLLTIHHTKTWFWQKKSTTMENECFDVSTRIRWSWSYRLCLLEKQKGNREEKQKHCHSCSTVQLNQLVENNEVHHRGRVRGGGDVKSVRAGIASWRWCEELRLWQQLASWYNGRTLSSPRDQPEL